MLVNFKHTDSYHRGHPNPQCFREDYQLLNGQWKFYFDEEDVGINLKYYEKFPSDYSLINVPYAYQTKSSGITKAYKQCDVIWYEKEIEINDLNKIKLLKFLGVDYLTDIYINSVYCFRHEGGYDSFELELNKYLHLGKNKITLRVEDKYHVDQLRGKQRWRENNFTCFYKETSGIYKDVYLENLNEIYIKYFSFKGFFNEKKLNIHYELSSKDNLILEIYIKELKETHNFIIKDISGDLVIHFDEIIGYSDENPYLYNVILSLKKDNSVLDKIHTYFGFITFEAKNKRIFVNNKDTYLKFVLDQGYYPDGGLTPTEEEIINDLTLIKKCGLNGLRKHEKVESPLYHYYLDIFGLYVWLEVPSAHEYSYELKKKYIKQVNGIIKDNYSHPTIMSYVLFNESWGINEIKESAEIQEFVNDMYLYYKKNSIDRFIISNDGWEHEKSDLLTFHNYAGTYEELVNIYKPGFEKVFKGANADTITNYKTFYVGGFHYENEPVIFSEFAGIAFSKDLNSENWGYGESVKNEEEFLNKYKNQLKFIKDYDFIRGFCITQFTDTYQEVNGLFTFDRSPKVDIKKLRKMHEEFK